MKMCSYSLDDFIQILNTPLHLSDITEHILGVGIFVVLTSIGAFVRAYLPFTPVPITLQTFFVLLSGAFLGSVWGASAMGIYLLIGICGFPVFASASSGLFCLLGPTGGYLIGFVVAAWIVGNMIGYQSNPSWRRIFSGLILASLSIYALGITQLMLWGRCNMIQALWMGFFPFLPGAAIKILLAGIIIKGLKRR